MPDLQPSQPRSISKFHDQIAVDASLNNLSPILTATPLGATRGALDVDHHQTSVLRGPHVYVPVPNAQYLRIPSNYDGSAPRNLQRVPDIRVSYVETPVLSMAPSDDLQPHAANRFFREHVEAASGLSATERIPARYEETSRNVPVPRQFEPLSVLQYQDGNILLSEPRRREYDPPDTTAMGPTLVTGKSNTYRMGSDVDVANRIGPLPGYMDYILPSSQRSDDEGSIRSITSDDLDGLIRRNERLLWGKANTVKTPHQSPTTSGVDHVNLDENDMTAIVENELDRYISNIRKLHREHGVQSLDELDHEQNTSGDLLNVSLSEDALELSAEDRVRKVPEEMGKILALASDLASTMANLKEVARDSAKPNDARDSSLTEDGIGHREIATGDASELKGKCEAEGRATSVRNEIREDVATRSAKSEQPRGDTETAKENWDNAKDSAESRERDREASTPKKSDAKEEMIAGDESRIGDPRNGSKEKRLDLVTGEESNVEGSLDAAEELAPWDLANVQKKVHELRLNDSDGDRAVGRNAEDATDRIKEEITSESRDSPRLVAQSDAKGEREMENARPSQDALPRSETGAERLDASEVNEIEEPNQTHGPIEAAENVPSKVSSQADEAKIASQPDEEFGEPNGRKQDNDETTELRVDDQFEGVIKDSEYSAEQGYVEDPSQMQQYEQDPNQQYYDPNIPYEAGNEQYEGYAQEGQEYVEYVDGQYGQYAEDPNKQQYQHYPNAQYEQDPNQVYDYYDPNQGYGDPGQQYDSSQQYENSPDQQYDPNQQYEDNPDQQYDPNQQYENNPDNQAYDYTEQVPYDSNQTYDNVYEGEYKGEQRDPDDGAEDRAERPETEEASQGPEADPEPEPEHKSDGDGDKSQRADAVNEAGQSKKKKDVIKSLLDSDTDTTIERNVSNTESDFDFN